MESLMNLLYTSGSLLLQGAMMSIGLWLCAALISLVAGTLFGVVRSCRVRIPILSLLSDMITFIGRGIPFYVQLLIAYFVLPALLNIDLPVFAIAVTSLGLCSASYASQIVRGAINAVPVGQWESAQVLGFSRWQTVRFIIVPQIVPSILPAFVGELDQVLKSTSIFAAIGVLELTRAGMNIIARQMNPMPIYLSIAIIYLAISSVLNLIGYYFERRAKVMT